MVRIAYIVIIMLLCPSARALDNSASPHNSFEFTHDHAPTDYHLYYKSALPVTPYLSAEDRSNDNSLDTFWNAGESYESPLQPERGNAWAGVRVKLTKMFKLDVDTDLRNIRSSFAVTPKTKMRLRVRSRELKVEFKYRY